MKHVWILNHYAQEPSRSGGTRHFSLARELKHQNWQATIIAAGRDHITGKDRLAPGQSHLQSTHDGVDFLWLPTRPYSGNGLSRMANMLDFTRAALRPKTTAHLPRPDIIIGSSVHPLAALAGKRLSGRHNVPFIFEVRDLWPQTLIDMGRLKPNAPMAIAMRQLERHLYSTAARIVVLLPNAGEYITPLGIPAERIAWIPNGVDCKLFGQIPPPEDSTQFKLMYLGAHGGANGIDTLLDAMRIVEDNAAGKHIQLELVGDGPLKPELIAHAREIGLHQVRFSSPVPKSDIPRLAATADAFVMCVRDLPRLYRFGISMNKMFDYMASGRPTIISSSAINNPIADAGAGFTVPAGDPKLLADAILRAASTPFDERREMGEAGRRHVAQNYAFDRLAVRLSGVLNEACGAAR